MKGLQYIKKYKFLCDSCLCMWRIYLSYLCACCLCFRVCCLCLCDQRGSCYVSMHCLRIRVSVQTTLFMYLSAWYIMGFAFVTVVTSVCLLLCGCVCVQLLFVHVCLCKRMCVCACLCAVQCVRFIYKQMSMFLFLFVVLVLVVRRYARKYVFYFIYSCNCVFMSVCTYP